MQENLLRVSSITDSYSHEAKVSFKPQRNNWNITGFSYYEKFDERGKVLNMSENAQYICYLAIGEK